MYIAIGSTDFIIATTKEQLLSIFMDVMRKYSRIDTDTVSLLKYIYERALDSGTIKPNEITDKLSPDLIERLLNGLGYEVYKYTANNLEMLDSIKSLLISAYNYDKDLVEKVLNYSFDELDNILPKSQLVKFDIKEIEVKKNES